MKNKFNKRCNKREGIIREEITDDNFWIVKTGYSKNCELLSIPEVKFARIINEANEIIKRKKESE